MKGVRFDVRCNEGVKVAEIVICSTISHWVFRYMKFTEVALEVGIRQYNKY